MTISPDGFDCDCGDERHAPAADVSAAIHSMLLQPDCTNIDFGTAPPNAFWEILQFSKPPERRKLRLATREPKRIGSSNRLMIPGHMASLVRAVLLNLGRHLGTLSADNAVPKPDTAPCLQHHLHDIDSALGLNSPHCGTTS
ncbi:MULTISPECIES: hypothetical protein [Rhizobium]|uniref:hypothetical protein n=1 Tax=Rhizobium TaxID=379 RepID=UPI001B33EC79|nr:MULTISPECIES: hypothetical protein [Rhizobium]MBX4908919.1 hypothetical protein [Rhizobium bangladeshense]MBX5234431.1 hypothetical protein [Rhizobium sp. NLR4a]MBX5251433.1 hypothetical protein [Rhizobium sp. NLR4b]MBX5258051.1 hypothetical protein [Rhizobium sp. NLR16b]MBX5264144.1 hypothetical protein [Rhizobium sp. NLR16a]